MNTMKTEIETMEEGLPIAGSPPAGPGPGAITRDTVPTDALGMPDEDEQMEAPEVGDEVTYTVTGNVVSIEGGNAVIERKTINGRDLAASQPPQSPEMGLEADAAAMDRGGYGS
jgi:hypothetical protein